MVDLTNPTSRLGGFIAWALAQSSWTLKGLLFLTGATYSLAFAPTNIFPVIFLIFPIMIAFGDASISRKQAFSFGWWFGFGLFVAGINWIGNSFTQQDEVPAALAPFAIVGLSAVLAIYYGLAMVIYGYLKRAGLLRYFIFAAVWILVEALRSSLFTGFPWHVVASIWANWLPVAQSLYYVSVYGLGFITILVALIPAVLLSEAVNHKHYQLCTALTLLCVVIVGGGYLRLSENPTRMHIGMNMRLVQANIPQYTKWVSYLIDDHFDTHMALSRKDSVNGTADGIDLLIWPETAVQRQTYDRKGSIERWRLSRSLKFGAYAITGVPRVNYEGDTPRMYNSLMAINSRGTLYASYDKSHLVPFGEYLPFRSVFDAIGLSSLTGGSFSSGPGRVVIPLPGIPAFSPLICYEAIFPGGAISHRKGARRPDWLLNITNDAWFGDSKGPYQHLALVRMRAIEEGLAVVRSASTGISAVIDPVGRIVASLDVGVKGTLESPLPYALVRPMLSSQLKIRICLLLLLSICVYTPIARLIKNTNSQK